MTASADHQESPAEAGGEPQVFRVSGVSYLHIPAADAHESGKFYEAVFGWAIHRRADHASFADGTGHVIGAFVTDRPASGESGVLPYIYVRSVDDVLERVMAAGGVVVLAPYPEGDLWVATFRDPAGNVLGVWQQGRRG